MQRPSHPTSALSSSSSSSSAVATASSEAVTSSANHNNRTTTDSRREDDDSHELSSLHNFESSQSIASSNNNNNKNSSSSTNSAPKPKRASSSASLHQQQKQQQQQSSSNLMAPTSPASASTASRTMGRSPKLVRNSSFSSRPSQRSGGGGGGADGYELYDNAMHSNTNKKTSGIGSPLKIFMDKLCTIGPVKVFFEWIREFSFIGLLLSYSAAVCFIFGLILFFIGPPTKIRVWKVFPNGTEVVVADDAGGSIRSPEPHQQQQQQQQLLKTTVTFVEEQSQVVAIEDVLNRKQRAQLFWQQQQQEELLDQQQEQQQNEQQNALPPSDTLDDDANLTTTITTTAFPPPPTTTTSNSSHPPNSNNTITYRFQKHDPVSFVDAVYMSVTAFSASGLSTVNYAMWNSGCLAVLCIIMTLGDIVLLTIFPAVIRYRSLVTERDKLITILELTGAYGSLTDEEEEDGVAAAAEGNNAMGGGGGGGSRQNTSAFDDDGLENALLQNRTNSSQIDDSTQQQQYEFPSSRQNSTLLQDASPNGEGRVNSSSTNALSPNSNASPGDAGSGGGGDMYSGEGSGDGSASPPMSPTSFRAAKHHHHHPHHHSHKDAKNARKRATTILSYGAPGADQSGRASGAGGGGGDGGSPERGSNAAAAAGAPGAAAAAGGRGRNASTVAGTATTRTSSGTMNERVASSSADATATTAGGGEGHFPRQASTATSNAPAVAAAANDDKQQQRGKNGEPTTTTTKDQTATANDASGVFSDLDAEERQALQVAEKLTFGKRVVYEDGLANVNQQIDICLIIISGCVTYWFLCHLIFTLLMMAAGKNVWWSIFHVISAFNNAGLALSPDNMEVIQDSAYLMAMFSILMPLGNTLFPVFFRFQMSLLHRAIRRITRMSNGAYANTWVFGQPLIVWQHSVRLFLRYPRKYYTHMFSKYNTLILFLLWLVATVVGFCLFIPEFSHDIFPAGSSGWIRFWMAYFQTVSVRTTGFAIMNLDHVSTGHLAWWILAMYTSAYPFIVTVRATANEDMDKDESAADLRREATSVVGRDLFWLYLAVMLITYGEHANIVNIHQDYSLFLRIVFEISSGFGTVGLSLPMPDKVYSYSGSMSIFSKLIMIGVMYCGKHRGLPRGVDEAIAINVRQYDFEHHQELDPDQMFDKASIASLPGDSPVGSPLLLGAPGSPGFGSVGGVAAGGDHAINASQVGRKPSFSDQQRRNSGGGAGIPLSQANLRASMVSRGSGTTSLSVSNMLKSQYQNDDELLIVHQDGHVNTDVAAPMLSARGNATTATRSPAAGGGGQSVAAAASSGDAAAASPNMLRTPVNNATATSLRFAATNQNEQICFIIDDNGEVVKLTPEELFSRRVRAFYEHYNPARLPHLDRIVSAFETNPNALLRNLATTYGPEPGHARAMSAEAAQARMNAMSRTAADVGDDGGGEDALRASGVAINRSGTGSTVS